MNSFIGTQAYPWTQHYEQKGQKLEDNLEEALRHTSEAGLELWEGSAPFDADQGERLKQLLAKHNLRARTAYLGGRWHDQPGEKILEWALARVRLLPDLGVEYLVCNPEPVQWGSAHDKTDDQLLAQAGAYQEFAVRVHALGLKLVYHNHDSEMRHGAREFHHMMQSTDPCLVGYCLDVHWVYRGCGNSAVALFDIMKMYGDRIQTLHLRQSVGGVWAEIFGDGDIDYRAVFARLKDFGFKGPMILENAIEPGTPQTMPPAESLRRSCACLRSLWSEATAK